MALPWLQRVELLLFAAAFLCGALAAATLTRTQVRLRGRASLGVQQGLDGMTAPDYGLERSKFVSSPKELDKLPVQFHKLLAF